MLTFQEKLAIIESFPELKRHQVSLGRLNFHYEDSCYDKKNVVYHLHPNGNGYVYAGYLTGYDTDDKDMVNIRDYSADALRDLIRASIRSLSSDPAAENEAAEEHSPSSGVQEERWIGGDKQTLTLVYEDELWQLYYGSHLESAFETYEEAEAYLLEEGFTRKQP
ncbi:hypothetical protein [Paenibacillus piri]|uniref:Uncharacterized protein n=1 Tax=Paenibacillus piri TaxID=2547395 RepID=A0A4R5KNG4_9BACL|nr:hypothetical protein [Paenibacillus piri]TDF97181.1 hypothetical protein E1757_15230 [Paenibacillus piri]